MCDLEKDFKKIILSSDLSDEEKLEWLRVEAAKDSILEFLWRNPDIGKSYSELGLTKEQVLNAPCYHIDEDDKKHNFKDHKFENIITLYKYDSFVYGEKGYGDNSRRFCKTLGGRDMFYSYRDILRLNGSNPGFGSGGSNIYSIFLYRGGSNCKHFWTKYYQDQDTLELVKAPAGQQPRQVHKGKMPPPKK